MEPCVGDQGTGGVTFFNGTIINNTTGSGGSNNPVAFGDNVRIDGDIFNAAKHGDGSGVPLKITDDVRITGDVDLQGDLAADNVYTKTEVNDTFVRKAAPSWATRTGIIAIPASAFQPYQDGYDYSNTTLPLFTSILALTLDSGASALFNAPVYLPNNATITSLSMDAYDDQAGKTITVLLYRFTPTTVSAMASVVTSGDPSSVQTQTDSTITTDTEVVDNDTYAYTAQVFFSGSDPVADNLSFRRAEITYTYTQPN